MNIRRELRPGDLGEILAHHGRVYAHEYGLDARFEAMVATSIAEAAARGFPRAGEAVWIVENDGRHAGGIALTDEGGGEGMIRWVLLEPEVRGRGLGRRLVGEAVAAARARGYSRISLLTFSELTAAARLYREHGFEVVWESTDQRWGRAEITYQRYELDLDRDREPAAAAASPSRRPA